MKDEQYHSMQRYYDRRAAEFDDWYERRGRYNDPSTNAAWHAQVAELQREAVRWGGALARQVRPRVLDLACGTGKWSAALAQGLPDGGLLVGLDYAPAMLRQARARLEEDAPDSLAKTGFVLGDAYRLPFPGNTFDLVLCGFLLSHIPRPLVGELLEGLKRVMKPGANLLLFDSAMRPGVLPELIDRRALNDGSYHSVLKINYTPAQLEALLAASFGSGSARQTRDFFIIGQAARSR